LHKIERLDRSRHDRESFDCDHAELNSFLRERAAKNADNGVSATYVMVDDNDPLPYRPLGYYSLTTCQFRSEELPPELAKGLPKVLSAPLLAKLAVSKDRQRRGIGKHLIADILVKITQARALVGGTGLVVDAKDAASRDYYESLGFRRLGPESLRLYLPKSSIDSALESVTSKAPKTVNRLAEKLWRFLTDGPSTGDGP
jgi:GNAT superfamily N-acetyltransferase